jgi:myosin heavy subunit
LTVYKESQNTSKAEEVEKLMDLTRELEEVQAEMAEVKRMSMNKDQALSSQRKQLENFKTELEDALQTQKELEIAEKRMEELKDELQIKDRTKSEEIAKLKEIHTRELKTQIQKNEAAIQKQESLQEELKTLHGLLSSKDSQDRQSQSELQQLREALRRRDETIARQKRDLEQRDAMIATQTGELESKANASDSACAQAKSLQVQLDQAMSEMTSAHEKADAASRAADERFVRLQQDSAATVDRLEAELGKLRETNRAQGKDIARMQAELDKHELARARQQAIKAAKAPPDMSSLRAKLQNAYQSSGIQTPLSRSVSSNASSDQDEEAKVVKIVEGLRKELSDANAALEASRKTVTSRDEHIESLENEIDALNRKVEALREDLLRHWGVGVYALQFIGADFKLNIDCLQFIQIQSKALKELTPDDTERAEIPEDMANADNSTRPLPSPPQSLTPEPSSPEKRSRAPFAVLGHRASNSTNTYRASSRPSTPSKRDNNSHLGTPEPLPTPPDMWEGRNARKSRRITIDKELENLRLSQRAERSK